MTYHILMLPITQSPLNHPDRQRVCSSFRRTLNCRRKGFRLQLCFLSLSLSLSLFESGYCQLPCLRWKIRLAINILRLTHKQRVLGGSFARWKQGEEEMAKCGSMKGAVLCFSRGKIALWLLMNGRCTYYWKGFFEQKGGEGEKPRIQSHGLRSLMQFTVLSAQSL